MLITPCQIFYHVLIDSFTMGHLQNFQCPKICFLLFRKPCVFSKQDKETNAYTWGSLSQAARKNQPIWHLVVSGRQTLLWWANVWSDMGDRHKMVHVLWTERYVWRGKRDEKWTEVGVFITTQGHGDVWAYASVGSHFWVQTLKQPPSVLMFMAPDTTKGPEDRVLQNWPRPSLTNTREYLSCPSLAAASWREGPTPLLGR